jgi:hypothetical protein
MVGGSESRLITGSVAELEEKSMIDKRSDSKMIIRTSTATVYYPIAKRRTNSICRTGRVRSMGGYVVVGRKTLNRQ